MEAAGGAGQAIVGTVVAGAGGLETAGSGGTASPVSLPQTAFGVYVAANGLDHFYTGIQRVRTSQSQRTVSQRLLDRMTGSQTARECLPTRS